MTQTLEDIVEGFSLFDDWEDKYRYLIDMGDRLEEMDDSLKTDDNLVQGCVSRVWLVAGVKEGRFNFIADSDARIVKGLVYVLHVAYQGKTIEEIQNVDVEKAFESMGLNQHLSPNRRNGFFSIVARIKSLCP